jgi:hypothetical protein
VIRRAGQRGSIAGSNSRESGMTENAAAFHGIGPHHIGVHDAQYRIDVARIEGGVCAAEKIFRVRLEFLSRST